MGGGSVRRGRAQTWPTPLDGAGSMPCRTLYFGRDAPVVRPPAQVGVEAAAASLSDPRGWRMPRLRALLSVANREGIAALARDLQSLHVEIVATDGTREYLAGEGVEVGSVSDLTQVPSLVGGQVKTFHPAVYAGILARRDVPEQLAELEAQGIGPIDIVVVNVKPFAPEVGAKLVGLDEAIEMIDVGGAALLGAAARNAAGVTAVADPGPLPDGRRGAAGARAHEPGAAGAPGRRGVQHGRGLSRRDRRLPQPDLRQRLPEPARDRAREGGRAALRREPASAGGVLPRDDPPQRHARRRRPAPGRPPVVQQPARPRCGLSRRPGLHRADSHDRQAHRPGRAGVARGARRGLPARARDRSGRVIRRHRRA